MMRDARIHCFSIVCIYIYIFLKLFIYIHIFTYINLREREGEAMKQVAEESKILNLQTFVRVRVRVWTDVRVLRDTG